MRHLLFLLLFVSTTVFCQGIGLHPPSVDWQQIRTPYARILFPEGYAARAQRAAALIDVLATEHNRSIGKRLYDFDLVLQTPNMTVNGYVGLAPFRSEFFVTPPQSFNLLSATDWVDLLTIHEFRHVQQKSNERRGITKLFSYFQGQTGWAVASAIATPNWFSEGDAVIAETALTSAGRGRTPAFSKELRALLRVGTVYRYAKARNGSLRDLVPDHYRYGYGMLTYARERFGNDVWKDVLHQGAAYRSVFFPFSRALRRATGYTTKQLYLRTTADLMVRQDSQLIVDPATVTGAPIGDYDNDIRNYRFPFVDGQGRLLALRTSYRYLPAIVAVSPNARDEIITPVGIQREPWVHGGQQLIVWTELRQHPRYTNQSFSELVVYDLTTGTKRVLTENGHYLAASLCPDERELVAVWYDPLTDGPEIHLLDAQTGQLTSRRNFPQSSSVAWPRFAPDGRSVYFLALTLEGVAIRQWNRDTDEIITLRPPTHEPVDMLSVTAGGRLLFTSGRSGIDNVYQLDPVTRRVQPLTDVELGAYYPTLVDSMLYFSSPTSRGERLNQLRLDDYRRQIDQLRLTEPQPSVFERPAAFAAETVDITQQVVEKDYPVTNFSNTLGGLKLHSWSFNGSYVTPGASIQLSNALNTVAIGLTGLYNINEARYAGGAVVSYGGLPTVVNLTALYGDRNTLVQDARTDSLRIRRQEFSELSVGPTLTYPLQWISGNFVTGLTPFLGFRYVSLRDAEAGSVLPRDFGNLTSGLTISSLRRTALRQVQPRLGAQLGVLYDRALGNTKSGERLLLRSALFLPSVFPTHGFRIDADYQQEQAENRYQYTDVFTYARGYNQPLADWVYRLGVNYQMPLVYPDIGGNVVYLKRIRLLGFFDYSRLAIDAFENARFTERSVGYELYFDATWFNTAELSIGFQTAYQLDTDFFSAEQDELQTRLLLSGRF